MVTISSCLGWAHHRPVSPTSAAACDRAQPATPCARPCAICLGSFALAQRRLPGTLASMEPDRPHAIAASSGRWFATFPAAVVVPIVNPQEELLLLESQRRAGLWEPVNGAVEEGETLLEAALREVREEAGSDL